MRRFYDAAIFFPFSEPWFMPLFSLEEARDGSLIMILYTDHSAGSNGINGHLVENRISIHPGTKSLDYSTIKYHRRRIDGSKHTAVALTSAVKRGGYHIMFEALRASTAPQYRIPGARSTLTNMLFHNGQISYHVGISRREEPFENTDLISGYFPFCKIIEFGLFKIVVFLSQTSLPNTTQGFSSFIATLNPENLDEEDATLMRFMMTGMDPATLVAKFQAGRARLIFQLCQKLEIEHDKLLLHGNYAELKPKFDHMKSAAYDALVASGELANVDPSVPHRIKALTKEDRRLRR